MKLQKDKIHKKEVRTINKKKKKYKILPVILAIMIIVSGMCMPVIPVMANTHTEGTITYTYTLDGDNAIITGYADSGSTTNLDIPNTLDGHPVTSIGYCAFYYCIGLTSIIIPESVTSIGVGAFSNCTGLTSIIIPESVTSIGDYAFYNCSNLKEINVANNNNYYASDNGVLFNKDKTILIQYPISKINTNYIIPESVTSIDNYAFSNCTGLTSITIPESVTSIGDYAFYNCTGLTSITIPESVTSIGNFTFYNCTGLTSITIPESVTSIGYCTFYNCTGLTSITIPEGVTSIGVGAFYNCTGLTSITILEGVTSIGYCAFGYCTELNTLIIENSKVTIDYYAFTNCSSLTAAGITVYQNPNDTNTSITINGYTITLNTTIVNSIAPINSGNATLDDYINAGITGVTADNLEAVNSAVAAAKTAAGVNLTKSQIQKAVNTVPYELTLTQNDSTLTAQLKKVDGTEFTTSSAVTYDWYRNDEAIASGDSNTYNLFDGDKGTSIKAKVSLYGVESNSIYIPGVPTVTTDDDSVTTSSAVIIETPTDEETTTSAQVTIKGTERVGKTLEAVLLSEDGAKITTLAGVSYEWYRLSDEDSSSGTLIGSDKTYKLVSSDKGKYIKVAAEYDGESFEAIAGPIKKKASSNNSDSSSEDDDSKTESNVPLVDTSGLIPDGWQKQSDNTWKYGENGQTVVGWKQINGIWYLFDSTGTMETGFRQEGEKTYYLDNQGAMATDWELVNGSWCLFDETGAMLTGWQQVDGKWYYLNPNGTMATGWISIEGKWYYLNGDGSLAVSTVINGYTVDENGGWN